MCVCVRTHVKLEEIRDQSINEKENSLERRVLDKPHEKYKQVQNKNRKWEKSISQKIHIF